MKVMFYFPAFENLGVQVISALLRKHGHETELLFDPKLFNDLFTVNKRLARGFSYEADLLHQVVRFQPDLICISTLTDNYIGSLQLVREIKRVLPQVRIAYGGIHVTSVPERVLAQDCVDFVCVGEGEYPILELVQHLEEGERDFPIRNIWYKKEGQMITNPLRPLLEDLDSLPWPDKELFYRQAPYAMGEYNSMSMRGCPYQCTYCHNSIERRIYQGNGAYIRRRSVDNFIGELRESVRRYNWKTMKIWDEVFTLDKKWLREFAERYRVEVNRPFWCFVHPNFVDPEVVEILKYAGCWQANMGVQSLDLKVKKALGRLEPLEAVGDAIHAFRKAGIQVVVDQMLSLPGQEPDDLETAFRFYLENPPSHINTYWLRYFPRTPIVDQAKELGLLDDANIAELEEGTGSLSFTRGGTRPREDMEPLQTVLAFQPILPRAMVKWLAALALKGRLPSIRFIGHIVSRGAHWNFKKDVGGRRYAKHYIHFMLKRLRQWLTFSRPRPIPPNDRPPATVSPPVSG